MKRKNLPINFPVEKLSQFDFGDVDAFRDDYLFSAFCSTNFVKLARNNKRTLLIGPKGSGKSAVFKAFMEGKLYPADCDKNKCLIIGISDELKYLDTEKIISDKFAIYGYSKDFKYALLWDFYIIFRALIFLGKNYFGKFTDQLKSLSGFFQHIDIPEKSNLTIFLDKLKNIKFAASASDGTTVYTSTIEYDSDKSKDLNNKFALHSIKEDINDILKQNHVILWIMFDKLDDFLLREEYDVQRRLMQGLVITEDAYSNQTNIFIKIFLRTDLFKKIDFSFVGYDKLSTRKVTLDWKPNEIRSFIAKRLAFNLFKTLNLKELSVRINTENLTRNELLDESSLSDITQEDKGFLSKILKDKRHGRTTSIEDEISKAIITLLYPRQVLHFNREGHKKPIDIFIFFETHFNFANDQPTPRVLMQFLDLTIQKTKSYYEDNRDEALSVTLDSNGEYTLIKRICFEEAYGSLTKQICENIMYYDRHWQPYIERIFEEKGKKRIFTFGYFKKLLKLDENELKALLAFLEHIGCFKRCPLDIKNPEKTKYELPLFLQAKDFYK